MLENETKILLLQLRRHRKRFLSIIKSYLLKKESSKADTAFQKIKTQIQIDMEKNAWDYVPKAKLSASLRFHSNRPYIPELPKLVKYLLDILCITICNDDKQIRHLAACCYRPSNKEQKTNDDSIFIEVERLTDYKNRFKLFAKLMQIDEFREYLRYQNYGGFFDDEDDKRIEDLWPDEEAAKILNLPSDTVNQLHRMTIQQNQQKLLSINKLDTCDWPEGPKDCLFPIKKIGIIRIHLFFV
jgi:hypothetical protein